MPRPLVPLACLVFSGLALPNSVLVVGPSGAPYATIQAAVDAAQHGDVVLVRPGTYPSFALVDKGVAVVADLGGACRVQGSIAVRDLDQVRDVLLHRLEIEGSGFGSVVEGCDGSVRLQRLSLQGPMGQRALRVEESGDVAVQDCNATGGNGFFHAGDGVYARGSQLAFHACDLRGGDGGGTGCGGGNGGDGLDLQSAYGYVAGSLLTGGAGHDASTAGHGTTWPDGGNGGHGLRLTFGPGGGSHAAYADAVLIGGTAGSGAYACVCNCGLTSCCSGKDGAPGAPIATTAGPSSSVAYSAVPPRLDVGNNPVREQQLVVLSFHGQPGDRVALLLSTETTFVRWPAASGVRLVARDGPPWVVILGTIGVSGTLVTGFYVLELGAGVGARIVHLQPVHRDPSGRWTVGNLVSLVQLDSAY